MQGAPVDNEKTILVTGGAGYIGSHTVRLLHRLDQAVVVLDNLTYGHRAAVDPGIPFYEGDTGDADLVESVFNQHEIDAIIHFAGYTNVGESVENPLKYYRNNIVSPLTLLEVARDHGCTQFVFSSTCATYGNPERLPLVEEHPQNPINPYGRTKLMWEHILADCETAFGLRHVSLRYFNACGTAFDGLIGEDHDPETHLIPLVLAAALGTREAITVFGTDYPTTDGTCIRDYIHVEDLAKAHVAAVKHLRNGGESTACNLGTGTGVSVKEILRHAEAVTGREIPVVWGDRRAGDPAELVADPSKAREVLGWVAEHQDVRVAIKSCWRWMTAPHGGRYPS